MSDYTAATPAEFARDILKRFEDLHRRLDRLEQAHTVAADRPPHFAADRPHSAVDPRCPATSPEGFRCLRYKHNEDPDLLHYAQECGNWKDAEPVPEWRRLVDDHIHSGGHVTHSTTGKALSAVLSHLAYLADTDETESTTVRLTLACVVAVCEAQVGDHWQANPPDEVRPPVDLELLLRCPVTPQAKAFEYATNWKRLATYAAAWLRDLTEDGEA